VGMDVGMLVASSRPAEPPRGIEEAEHDEAPSCNGALDDSNASRRERDRPSAIPISPRMTEPATCPIPQRAVTRSALRRDQDPALAIATKGSIVVRPQDGVQHTD
jgi:hypothetical protein